MKYILILIMGMFILMSISVDAYVFNVTNNTVHEFNWSLTYGVLVNAANSYDIDWSTSAEWTGEQSTTPRYGILQENFTKPTNALNYEKINMTVKYWLNAGNSATCFSKVDYQCYNGTEFASYYTKTLTFNDNVIETIEKTAPDECYDYNKDLFVLRVVYTTRGGGSFDSDIGHYETNISYFADAYENLQTYNTTTQDTSKETFQINITYDNDTYTEYSANLVYNGTSYLGTGTDSDDILIFSSTIDIPAVESQTNLTFYWDISLTNSTSTKTFNSTENNQTVNPTIFTQCNATYPTMFLNTSIYKETDRTTLTALMDATFSYSLGGSLYKSYSFDSIENSTFEFCSNVNQTYYTDSTIKLSKTGYIERTYELFNNSFTNITTNISLYLLNESEGTNVIIEVVDQGIQPLEGYYVEIERYYPETNEYITVISDITDNFGRFVARLVENYVKYKFVFKDSTGTTVKTTEDIRVACKSTICVLPFVIEDTTDDFDRFSNITNFESSLSFDNSTNIFTVTWNDVTGDSPTFRLFVQRVLINGTVTVCNTTSTSLSSSLSCNVGSEKASYRAQFFRQVDDDERRISILNAKVGEIFGTFGKEGLIWVFLILFTLVAVGTFNPTIGALLYLVGTIGFGIIGIISFSIPVLIANILICVAFIWAFRG